MNRLAAAAAAALLLSFFGAVMTCETASAATPASCHGSTTAALADGPTGAGASGEPHGSPGVLSGNVVRGG